MPPLILSEEEVEQLKALAHCRSLLFSIVQRAQIVLACGAGETNTAIATRMGLRGMTVGKWRNRYRDFGVEGLNDKLHPGQTRTFEDDKVAEVINRALRTKTADVGTQRSARSLAAATGITKNHRIPLRGSLRLQALHRSVLCREGSRHRRPVSEPTRERFRALHRRKDADSCSGQGAAAAARGIGLRGRCDALLHPPEHHRPNCSPGCGHRCGDRRMHAPSPAPGSPQLSAKYRQSGAQGARSSPDRRQLLANVGTQKKACLAQRPRLQVHFTPTYAFWLSRVERWFGLITRKAIRRGSFSSIKKLIKRLSCSWRPTKRQRCRSSGPTPRTQSWRSSRDLAQITGTPDLSLILKSRINSRGDEVLPNRNTKRDVS